MSYNAFSYWNIGSGVLLAIIGTTFMIRRRDHVTRGVSAFLVVWGIQAILQNFGDVVGVPDRTPFTDFGLLFILLEPITLFLAITVVARNTHAPLLTRKIAAVGLTLTIAAAALVLTIAAVAPAAIFGNGAAQFAGWSSYVLLIPTDTAIVVALGLLGYLLLPPTTRSKRHALLFAGLWLSLAFQVLRTISLYGPSTQFHLDAFVIPRFASNADATKAGNVGVSFYAGLVLAVVAVGHIIRLSFANRRAEVAPVEGKSRSDLKIGTVSLVVSLMILPFIWSMAPLWWGISFDSPLGAAFFSPGSARILGASVILLGLRSTSWTQERTPFPRSTASQVLSDGMGPTLVGLALVLAWLNQDSFAATIVFGGGLWMAFWVARELVSSRRTTDPREAATKA